MDTSKEVGLAAACKDFFGTLPGQGLKEFQAEYKALTQTDKEEIRAGLTANGYRIRAD